MTRDESQFTSLKPKDGLATFEDNSKGKIIKIGSISKTSSTSIENVLLVKELKHNLLSISQLCDKGCKVVFESSKREVIYVNSNKTILTGYRQGNIYIFDLNDLSSCKVEYLAAMNSDESWLWRKRLGHNSMSILSKVFKNDLVKGISKIKFDKDRIFDICQLGKQTRFFFKFINMLTISRPLQLLHMDLFGPSKTLSFGRK